VFVTAGERCYPANSGGCRDIVILLFPVASPSPAVAPAVVRILEAAELLATVGTLGENLGHSYSGCIDNEGEMRFDRPVLRSGSFSLSFSEYE